MVQVAQPYVGEIRMFAGNFAPAGWIFCEGQLLSISDNEALFELLGTTYGGDGQSTFGIPDLQGRIPIHQSQATPLGQQSGVEQVTLTVSQIPPHNHALMASTSTGVSANAKQNVTASSPSTLLYFESASPRTPLAPQSVQPVGSSQPHNNLQPFLCVNFIISLFGIFPSPT